MATQLTASKLSKAYDNARKAGDKEAMAYFRTQLQKTLASNGVNRSKLSSAFYAASVSGDMAKAKATFHLLRNAGLSLKPRTEREITQAELHADKNATAGMSWGKRGVAGFDQGITRLGRGFMQHAVDPVMDYVNPVESGPSRVEQARAYEKRNAAIDAALSHDPAGAVGNIIGTLAATAPLMATPIGEMGAYGRLAALAGQGGVLGYLEPSKSRAGNVVNTIMGAASGPLMDLGLRGLIHAGSGTTGLLNRALKNRAGRAAEDVVATRATNPELARVEFESNLPRNSSGVVDPFESNLPRNSSGGVEPTVRQTTSDEGLLGLENAARKSEEGGRAMADRDKRNNAKIIEKLKGFDMGDPDVPGTDPYKVQKAASKAIDSVVEPNAHETVDIKPLMRNLVDVAAQLGKYKNAKAASAAKAILKQLGGDAKAKENALAKVLEAKSKGASVPGSAARKAYDEIKRRYLDEFTKPTVEEVDAIRRNLNDTILDAMGNPVGRKRAPAAILRPIEKSLTDAVNKAAPGYKEAVRTYGERMAPVNSSELVRETLSKIENRGQNELPSINVSDAGSLLEKLLARDPSLKKSPEVINAVRAIRNHLRTLEAGKDVYGKILPASEPGATPGVAPALGRAMRNNSFLSPFGLLGSSVGGAASMARGESPWMGAFLGRAATQGVTSGINALFNRNAPEIASEVTRRLLDPRLAALAIEKHIAAQEAKNALLRLATRAAQVTPQVFAGPSQADTQADTQADIQADIQAYLESHPDTVLNGEGK